MVLIASGVSRVLTSVRESFKSIVPILILLVYTLIGAGLNFIIYSSTQNVFLSNFHGDRRPK